jgi:hypothetical protein
MYAIPKRTAACKNCAPAAGVIATTLLVYPGRSLTL